MWVVFDCRVGKLESQRCILEAAIGAILPFAAYHAGIEPATLHAMVDVADSLTIVELAVATIIVHPRDDKEKQAARDKAYYKGCKIQCDHL